MAYKRTQFTCYCNMVFSIAEDAHFSVAPDLTSNFCRCPCLLCSSLNFFLWTFDLDNSSLSPYHERKHVCLGKITQFDNHYCLQCTRFF